MKKEDKKKKKNIKKAKNKKEDVLTRLLSEKKYTFFDALLLIILVAITSFVLTTAFITHKYKRDSLLCTPTLTNDKNLERFTTVYEEVIDNYYEKIDKKEMTNAAIKGMTDYLEDKYSIKMDDFESESFTNSLEGSYEGIGIVIQGTKIIEVYDKSPAAEAGIKVDDELVKLNDEEITEENLQDVIGRMKGEAGKKVNISVKRNNKQLDLTIEMKKIALPIVTSDYIEMDKNKIGYIKISSFTDNSYEQFSEQLVELEKKGIEKLIIDLRSNNGGYLDKATNIAELLVEKGKVIYTLKSKEKTEDKKDKTNDKREYPIVVLINEGTASAAEILAATLKDNNNAILVGKKSYGKGKVQNTKKLSDGTVLKYTSAKWYRPNGKSIDEKGIKPDHDIDNEGEEDKQYEKALELLK